MKPSEFIAYAGIAAGLIIAATMVVAFLTRPAQAADEARPSGESFVVARTGAGIEELAERKLVAAGKPKLVAIIAVARKLLIILNAILRDKTPWQPKTA